MFRADELTEIAGGAVSYRQVGANLQGRALQMIHERYRPGAQSGAKMLSHQGEEAGVVIKGRLALEVDGRRYELEAGDAYSLRQPQAACLPQCRRRRTGARLGLHAADLLTGVPTRDARGRSAVTRAQP